MISKIILKLHETTTALWKFPTAINQAIITNWLIYYFSDNNKTSFEFLRTVSNHLDIFNHGKRRDELG
jgi:hypothetical protein